MEYIKGYTAISNKTIPILIYLLIFSTQGVLTYKLFDWINFTVGKSAFTESIFLLIFIILILDILINKYRFKTNYIFLFIFLISINIIMILRVQDIADIMYSFKEVSLIFFSISIFFYYRSIIHNCMPKILILLGVLVSLNLLFAFYSFMIGSEEYSKFVLGHFFYGSSEEGNFKISHINGLLRTPALIGSSVAFGYFSFFSFLIFINYRRKILSGMAILGVILSFTRSVYLSLATFIIIFSLYKLFKKGITVKTYIVLAMLFMLFITLLITNPTYITKLTSIDSFIARIGNWLQILETTNFNFLNFLFGGFYGLIGNANDSNINFLSVFDNSWLFYLFNLGFIGIVMVLFYIIVIIKKNKRSLFVFVPICLAMFFVNITQSEVFLVLFPMVLLIFSTKNKVDYN